MNLLENEIEAIREAKKLADTIPDISSADMCMCCVDELIKVIGRVDSRLNAANVRIKRLEREVKTLRLYGNKDCTAQADEVLKEQAKPGESAIECLTSSTATKIDVALLDVEFEWKEAE